MGLNLADWALRGILPSGRIESISDVGLQALISGKFASGRPGLGKEILPVPELDGAWHFHVADMLLKLGEHTFPSAGARLGTLARYAPILKYMYAFEDDGTGRIVTSAVIEMVAYRSRGIVSEELGVGFSLIAAEKWLRESLGLTNIRFFDIDLVVKDKYPNIKHRIRSATMLRADWLIRACDPARPERDLLFLLESKGTATKNYHGDMLKKAVQQLAATTIDGHNLQGLAVCTYSPVGDLNIYAIDPPGNFEESDIPFFETPERLEGNYRQLLGMSGEWREISSPLHDENPETSETILGMDLKSEPLSQLTELQSALNLAHWSSDYALLENLHLDYGTPIPRAPRNVLESKRTLQTSVGVATGYVLRIPGCPAAVFAGVMEKVRTALTEHDFIGVKSITSEYCSVRAAEIRPAAEGVEAGNLAISDSGAVLALIDL